MKLELDYGRPLSRTKPETQAKIRAALAQFYQGRRPTAAELARAEEEYLAYAFESSAPKPVWWDWGSLQRHSEADRRRYARARYGRFDALSTRPFYDAPGYWPGVGFVALVLGTVGYLALSEPKA